MPHAQTHIIHTYIYLSRDHSLLFSCKYIVSLMILTMILLFSPVHFSLCLSDSYTRCMHVCVLQQHLYLTILLTCLNACYINIIYLVYIEIFISINAKGTECKSTRIAKRLYSTQKRKEGRKLKRGKIPGMMVKV